MPLEEGRKVIKQILHQYKGTNPKRNVLTAQWAFF